MSDLLGSFMLAGYMQLVSWCFNPSQPQRVTSGLKGTFIKRYTVEKTSKAEIRPEEKSEKAESCCENLWNEIQLKGPQTEKQTQEQRERMCAYVCVHGCVCMCMCVCVCVCVCV